MLLDHLSDFKQASLHLLVLYFRELVAILYVLLHSVVFFENKRTIKEVEGFIA